MISTHSAPKEGGGYIHKSPMKPPTPPPTQSLSDASQPIAAKEDSKATGETMKSRKRMIIGDYSPNAIRTVQTTPKPSVTDVPTHARRVVAAQAPKEAGISDHAILDAELIYFPKKKKKRKKKRKKKPLYSKSINDEGKSTPLRLSKASGYAFGVPTTVLYFWSDFDGVANANDIIGSRRAAYSRNMIGEIPRHRSGLVPRQRYAVMGNGSVNGLIALDSHITHQHMALEEPIVNFRF